MNNYQTLLEMWREEKKKNEELRKELEELRADNKKLAKQIDDKVNQLRKIGAL